MLDQLGEMLAGVNAVSVFFRLLLAVIFGGVIGIERGIKRRPAGLRTYMLVCLGAALVMITNQYIAMTHGLSDPARLGAQVISGIGFLGAGTIIVTRHHQVIGLTTAAGLWASACMGLAIGIGFYEGAIMGTGFIVIIITLMHRLDNKVVSTSKSIEVYVELLEGARLSDFLIYVHDNNMRAAHVEIIKSVYGDAKSVAALVSVRLPKRHSHIEIVERLSKAEGVSYVEEV